MRQFLTGAAIAAASLAMALPAPAMQYHSTVAAIPSVAAQHEAEMTRLPNMSGSHDFTIITASKQPADLATLKEYFTKFGFSVTEAPGTHDLLLHGTYTQAARSAGTTYTIDRAHGVAFVRTASRQTFPGKISRLVAGTSFNPGRRMRSYAARPKAAIQGPVNGYSPQDVASVYDINPVYAAGVTGKGVNVAIVACSTVNHSDIKNFGATFGLPSPDVHYIPVDGTTDVEDGEATLDIERVYATAPKAAIYIYLAPDCSFGEITDAFAKVASDNSKLKFAAVSHSYGADEIDYLYFDDPEDLEAEDAALAEIAAQYVPIFAASGDGGSWGDLFDNETDVSFPASDSSVLSVGATTLETDASDQRLFEYAWSGSGGGVSELFATPNYQLGLAGISTAGKNVPDVAIVGDPETGLAYYWANNIYGAPPLFAIGGTSASTPTIAGVWALLDEYRAKHGIGYSTVPQHDLVSRPNAFYDVTVGTNGYFAAKKGYDNVTGIGVPDVAAFLKSF